MTFLTPAMRAVARLEHALLRLSTPAGADGAVPHCLACLALEEPQRCPQVGTLLRLHVAARELNEKVQELNATLARQDLALADGRAEFDEYTYSVSHELRAPARQLNSFTSLLLSDVKGEPLTAEAAQYLPLIETAARRLGQQIDALVAYSRVGRAEFAPANVSSRELFDQARLALEPAMNGRGIAWKIGALPMVFVEPNLIRQGLTCLLDNALKFTRYRPQTEIEIGCLSGPEEHVFHVRDNGVGFDPQQADRLFGFFRRLHRSDEFEGIGMGLATFRRILRRHGGRAWAEGNLGQGACIYFSVPIPNR